MQTLLDTFQQNKNKLVLILGKLYKLIAIIKDNEDYYFVVTRKEENAMISCTNLLIPMEEKLTEFETKELKKLLMNTEEEDMVLYMSLLGSEYEIISE